MAGDAVTELLARWQRGDERAAEQAVPLVYRQLRRIAHRLLRDERADHTLQATAIVHEAYLQLVERVDGAGNGLSWRDRQQFYGFCAHLMRRLLVRHARRRRALKRGGGVAPIAFDETLIPADSRNDIGGTNIEALDQALDQLAQHDRRKSRIIELRVFGGLSIVETADFLGVSTRTVDREWRKALAWIGYQLGAGSSMADCA